MDFSNIMSLLLAGVMAVIGFIVGTPYAVLDYSTFLRTDGPKGALWQFTNVGSVELAARPLKFVNEMVYRIADDLGYVILGGFFLLFFILLVKLVKEKNEILLSYQVL